MGADPDRRERRVGLDRRAVLVSMVTKMTLSLPMNRFATIANRASAAIAARP
jgi:hypothetical protein